MEQSGRGRRVLLIDDDPDTVLYLTSLLEDSGFVVRSGNNQRDALAALEASVPDVLILDVILTGRSGLDLLVQIRQDARWADVPVLVVTGDDGIQRDRGQSYLGSYPGMRGPDAVLGKPIEQELFLATVGRLSRE